jgi:hypothetical protein
MGPSSGKGCDPNEFGPKVFRVNPFRHAAPRVLLDRCVVRLLQLNPGRADTQHDSAVDDRAGGER